MRKYYIECGPPTPNGRLHLGHIAGPFIAADLFNRIKLAEGNLTFFPCDIDINQSYVRLAAIKAGITREELLASNIMSIKDTFADYDIGFNLFNNNPNTAREEFIINFAEKLFKSEHITLKDVDFYYEEESNFCLVEAFISGSCPKCGSPVKGGLCEVCGYYNFSTDIINPYSTINPNTKIIKRSCKIFVLNTVALHKDLIRVLSIINIDDRVRKFITKIMLNMPKQFPVTLPLEDGLNVGLPGVKLSPWVEVLGATYYMKQLAQKKLNSLSFSELSHVCFVGIDNTYYYTIIYNLIRLCMKLDDFPERYYINNFYLLNSMKFSASKDNAVWADETVQQYDVNSLRIFLALTHPETEPYHFSIQELVNFNNYLKSRDWINKLFDSFKKNIDECHELEQLSPRHYAQSLFEVVIGSNVPSHIASLIQIICPNLYKNFVKRISKIPQIIKAKSNNFKREFGVKLNRLIGIDEYNFGSCFVAVSPGEQTTPHSHNTIDELFYIVDGEGLLMLGDQELIITEGDYVYVPAGMMHALKQVGDSILKFISIAWYT